MNRLGIGAVSLTFFSEHDAGASVPAAGLGLVVGIGRGG